MPNTKVPIELSSTPGIIDNSTVTAITIDSAGAATFSGNVGIGTSSPSEKLHIQGDGADILLTDAAGGQTAKLGATGSNNGLLELNNSAHVGTVFLNSSGDSYFNGGNVGIGTSSPTANTILHLKDTDTQIKLESTNGSNSAFIDFDGTNLQLSTNRNMIDGAFSNTGKSAAGIFMASPSGGSHIALATASANNTTPTERMRIDSSGNVGIGTSSPAAKLDLGTSIGQKLLMYANSNIKYGMSIEASEYRMFAEDQANLTFGHMARSDGSTYTERMRISSAGNIVHNMDTGSALSQYIEGGASRGYIGASNSLVSAGLTSFCVRGESGIILSIAGAQSMVINSSGHPFFPNIRNSAGSYTAKITSGSAELTFDTSSARYKDNIRDSDYGLSAVMQLQSRMFEYKEDNQRTDVGFIAEEVNEVIPELVVIDAEGRPDAVNYDRMTSVLLKGMQEQQAIIEALTARIEALEGA
jgi:hypothetical protein